MGTRTTNLPTAAAAADVIVNEDIGGGVLRSARLAYTVFRAAIAAFLAGDSAFLAAVVAAVPLRARLTANRTYFVRTDGNDNNTGLVDSAGGAFLTIQKAVDVVAKTIDLAGFDVTIQVKDGTFTGAVLADMPWVGDGIVTIQGNNGTPANVIISTTSVDAITAKFGAVLTVKDAELRTTTSGNALTASQGGKVAFQNLRFGACAGAQIAAVDSGYVECTGNYSAVGSGVQHFLAIRAGVIRFPAARTVTLTGTPAFSDAFAAADRGGTLQVPSITFSGSGTGTRFKADTNAVILTGAAGINYFPGNAAGTVLNGARYDTNIGTSHASQQGGAQATLTDAATVTWDAETQQVATVTLAGNRTLGAISNPRAGFTYILRVVQDGTGSRTLDTTNAIYWWPGGTNPVLSTAANAVDLFSFYYDGTKMLGAIQKGFAA